MFYKTLKPIRDRLSYSKQLEQLLSYDIYQLIYKPLIDLLSGVKKENASIAVLVQAFLSRKIYYDNGFVYGVFSSRISKSLRDYGADYNKTKKAFKIELAKFPQDIRSAVSRGSMVEQQAVDQMRKKLQELSIQSITIPGTTDISKGTLSDLHEQFDKVTPSDLEIPIQMHQVQEEQLRKDYTDNIHLEINGLAQDAIQDLRYKVEEAIGQGVRAEKLKDILVSQHGVTANRAKFIARQETSLFVAKYRRVRYEDAGLNKYQWSTSNDSHVRHDHKELNGQIFSWDDPPITNKSTGARNNPGEDFGCRCIALPVVLQPGIKFKKGMTEGNLLEVT